MKIKLHLPTFREFVRNTFFTSEENVHPVFYYEGTLEIFFYKYVKGVLYTVSLLKEMLPDGITIDGLKQEFNAIEVPERPDQPLQITGTIT